MPKGNARLKNQLSAKLSVLNWTFHSERSRQTGGSQGDGLPEGLLRRRDACRRRRRQGQECSGSFFLQNVVTSEWGCKEKFSWMRSPAALSNYDKDLVLYEISQKVVTSFLLFGKLEQIFHYSRLVAGAATFFCLETNCWSNGLHYFNKGCWITKVWDSNPRYFVFNLLSFCVSWQI